MSLDLTSARKILQECYACDAVSTTETKAEIANLSHKQAKGSLDDIEETVVARLETTYQRDLSAIAAQM